MACADGLDAHPCRKVSFNNNIFNFIFLGNTALIFLTGKSYFHLNPHPVRIKSEGVKGQASLMRMTVCIKVP